MSDRVPKPFAGLRKLGLKEKMISPDRPKGRAGGNTAIAGQLSVIGHEVFAMSRLLVLALGALCFLPTEASAEKVPKEPVSSEISARQRCVCSSTWRRPARIVHKRLRIRTAYVIGYDPLPYRFGSITVWERPYRYYWR